MNSVVSYPDRGIGGNNLYRGNCSPQLISDLILQYHVSYISDFMCGSGTTEDVAKVQKIGYQCYDLNRGFDLINHDIPNRSEFIFWHPPYWDIITYSDVMYKASDIEKNYGFNPIVSDLSRIKSWDSFVRVMNECMIKQFQSLEKGGRIATLVGDVKKRGRLYSMIFEIAKPGTLEQCIIKRQHNTLSSRKSYSASFIPIEHEYVLILKKDSPVTFNINYNQSRLFDIRDMKKATWRDIIASLLEHQGSFMELSAIYQSLEGHRKTETNPHWKEKVRQTLNSNHAVFTSCARGVWGLQLRENKKIAS